MLNLLKTINSKALSFGISALSRAISGFYLFFLALFIAKYYGPSARGDFSIISSIAAIVGVVGGASLGRGILSLVVMDQHKTQIYISLSAIKTLKFSLVASLLIPIFYMFYNVSRPVFFVAVTVPLAFYYAWQAYSPQAFSILGKLAIYDKVIIFTRLIFLVVVSILILFFNVGFWQLLLVSSLSIVIFIITELSLLFKLKNYREASKTDCNALYKGGLDLHLDSIAGLAAAPILMTIAALYLSRGELGSLALAGQFLAPLTIVPNLFNLLVIKRLTRCTSLLPIHKLNSILPLFLSSFFITLISIGIIILFSQEILSLIGKDYSSASKYLIYSVLLALSFPLSQSLVPLWSILGYSRLLSMVSLATTLIGIGLGLILIPKYGAMGTIFSQMFIYFSSFIFNLLLVYRIYLIK